MEASLFKGIIINFYWFGLVVRGLIFHKPVRLFRSFCKGDIIIQWVPFVMIIIYLKVGSPLCLQGIFIDISSLEIL